MAAVPTAFQVSPMQQQAIVRYVQNCVESLANTWNMRQGFLLRDQIYQREVDRSVEQSRAQSSNYAGDPFKLQNMHLPIVMPQVESALAYHAGVFLTGNPIFGVASNPSNEDAALQMESVIADNSIYFGWQRELIMFIRDGLKYNFGAIEVCWKKKKIYSLVDNPGEAEAKKNEIWYQGNYLRRLDPYNLIWDKRVLQPAEHHKKGEFGGYTELMSRIELKQLFLDLDPAMTMNARAAFESGVPTITLNGADSWYYMPQVNMNSFLGANSMLTSTNWLAWAMIEPGNGTNRDTNIRYNNMYEVTTLYGKIIPTDFRLSVPNRNQPQIWKFIVVNRQHVIFVERMTNAHGYLPILFCQPNEDGLGYQTKSFLDNATPFQYMGDSLWNAAVESKRRRVFDRIFYDPSRVRKEDIDRVTSVARIPVKQSAYGKPVSESVFAFPYHDENSQYDLQMAQSISEMADIANGQNKVERGQFQKGNKSRKEFETTMGNSNSRQQLGALLLESQVFTPMKEMIKVNVLQYQGGASYYNVAEKKAVDIKPAELRKAVMAFKVSDGLLPTDKLMSTDVLQVFMQTIQTSPLMQAEFDMVGAFAYWCKLQGASWFDEFVRSPENQQKVMDQLAAHAQASKAPGNPNAQQQAPTGQPGA
jgi:hypothetical protein